MNWDQIEGNWKQVKGKVKEQWGKLTDDDLDIISGKRDQLVGKLQERYGYSKEQAEKLADDWSSRHRFKAGLFLPHISRRPFPQAGWGGPFP